MSISLKTKSIVKSTNNIKETATMKNFAKMIAMFEDAVKNVQTLDIEYIDNAGFRSTRLFTPLTAINHMDGGNGNHLVWGKSANVEFVGEAPATEAPEFHSIAVERVIKAKVAKGGLELADGTYWVPFAMKLHFGKFAADNNKIVAAGSTFTKFFVNKTTGIAEKREIGRGLNPRQDRMTCQRQQELGFLLLKVEQGKGHYEVLAQQGATSVFAPIAVETSVVYKTAAERRAERSIF